MPEQPAPPEPIHPLQAAKTEVNAAIDGLLLGLKDGTVNRTRLARMRDAIDQLRDAIPRQSPRGRRASAK